jgi:hypothetical protein
VEQRWVADITYIRTWNGFVYLAFVLDCYSRMIVGWQLATHLRTDLVLDAVEMANGLRRPEPGLIAHTDRGSQYTSIRYTDRLDEIGAAPSVGSKGDAYDNAMAKAWVATYKSELVDGRRFPSFEHVEHETLHWIGFVRARRGAPPRVGGRHWRGGRNGDRSSSDSCPAARTQLPRPSRCCAALLPDLGRRRQRSGRRVQGVRGGLGGAGRGVTRRRLAD